MHYIGITQNDVSNKHSLENLGTNFAVKFV